MHAHLCPATYLEIGVACGDSFRLPGVQTRAIGIDPAPRVPYTLRAHQKLFALTSDEFFARHDTIAELGGQRVQMAFIDGMHHFEFALRDFANVEAVCDPRAVIFIHDCHPIDARSSAREQTTGFWSGDVWRLILLLKKHRPDLQIHTLATPPTGLGMITHLSPASRLISQNLTGLTAEGLALDFAQIASHKPEFLNVFPNDWPKVRALLDAR
ncbi:MAG TPA: class I SAM-dependent methyltransferase [Steroidobacteraceae bacterium]|nr:class I SAM-dependent methyltransferase [Steroidobacteraceae bacterium]